MHKLLDIISELDEISFKSLSSLLCRTVKCDFKSCGYEERGLHLKSAIFSKLPVFLDISKKFTYHEQLITNFLSLFSHYLLTEDWRYFKSDVKSLLDDGTIYNVVELINDLSCRNVQVGFYDRYLCVVVGSYHQIYLCVQGTIYEDRFCRVEMRLLHRLAIKHFNIACRYTGTLQNILSSLTKETEFATSDDVEFYLDNGLYKKLASKFASYFSKEKVDYDILQHMIVLLKRLGSVPLFEDCMTLGDIRSLIKILPDLVNSKKHTDSSAPPDFFRSRLVLASSLTRGKLLEEKHHHELKQRNILLHLVENIKTFYKSNMEIVQLAFTMLYIYLNPENFSCRLSLNEIDQVLPSIPLTLHLLCSEPACKFAHSHDVSYTMDVILVRICCSIVTNLTRVKEDQNDKYIGAQLDTLEECDFVSTLGRVLVRTRDEHEVTSDLLMQTLRESCKLFGNNKFLDRVCKILPELAEIQFRCLSEAHILKSQAFCIWIVRKAAAYILDDLQPDFVGHIASQVLDGWLDLRILDGKILFSNADEDKNDELSLFDESIIDILRSTWWMIKKYPHLVKIEVPMFNKSFQLAPSSECTDLISSIIIETIKSYLDNSQGKSTDFLIELTTFVKDLSFDSVIRSPKKKIFNEVLVSACGRFIAQNSSGMNAENLQFFLDANK